MQRIRASYEENDTPKPERHMLVLRVTLGWVEKIIKRKWVGN